MYDQTKSYLLPNAILHLCSLSALRLHNIDHDFLGLFNFVSEQLLFAHFGLTAHILEFSSTPGLLTYFDSKIMLTFRICALKNFCFLHFSGNHPSPPYSLRSQKYAPGSLEDILHDFMGLICRIISNKLL
jgi:hypothetical protein